MYNAVFPHRRLAKLIAEDGTEIKINPRILYSNLCNNEFEVTIFMTANEYRKLLKTTEEIETEVTTGVSV